VWFYTLKNLQFIYGRPIYDFTGMLVQIGVFESEAGIAAHGPWDGYGRPIRRLFAAAHDRMIA